MKSFLFCLLLLIATSSVFAEFDMSAGITIGDTFKVQIARTDPISSDLSYHIFNLIEAGAFFDFTYGRVSVDFTTTFTKPLFALENGSNVSDVLPDTAWSQQYIVIQLVGKIPIEVRAVYLRLYPLFGLEYAICLNCNPSYLGAGSTLESWSDFIAVIGFGGDFHFTENIYLMIAAFFKYNITPAASTAPDYIYTVPYISLKIGTGFKFI